MSWAQVGNSMLALIEPGTLVASTVTRAEWLGLIQDSDLQPNCDEEGFNAEGPGDAAFHAARIGIIGNNENDCGSPDSRLGIGGRGTVCNTIDSAVGKFDGCGVTENNVAFGVVFIRRRQAPIPCARPVLVGRAFSLATTTS